MIDEEPTIAFPVLVPVDRTSTSYVTITEKKAPTDESVRLLRELEEKAKEALWKSVSVDNTAVECVVQAFTDHLSDRTCWRTIFRINDRALKAEVWFQGPRTPEDIRQGQDVFETLRDEMAKVIAQEMLGQPFIQAMQERWRSK